MKSLIFILLLGLNSYAEIPPSIQFSGNVRGDYTANYCRPSFVSIAFTPQANGNYEILWIEQGRLVQPLTGPCEIDYSANLFVSQRETSGKPIEWLMRYKFAPNHNNAYVTLNQNTYRFKAETENWQEGKRYQLQLDLLYNPQQNSVSYSRSMTYQSGTTETLFGPLFPAL